MFKTSCGGVSKFQHKDENKKRISGKHQVQKWESGNKAKSNALLGQNLVWGFFLWTLGPRHGDPHVPPQSQKKRNETMKEDQIKNICSRGSSYEENLYRNKRDQEAYEREGERQWLHCERRPNARGTKPSSFKNRVGRGEQTKESFWGRLMLKTR